MNVELGGPGVACSAMKVRRLLGGELTGEAARRAEAHLEGCSRCQASAAAIRAESKALEAAVPFETFASTVAERLALQQPVAVPLYRRALRYAPLALAASLMIAVATPLVWRQLEGERGIRTKGSAGAMIHVQGGAGVRELKLGEPIEAGAMLRVSLKPGPHRFAVVALVDSDGVAVLHQGPASAGPLPDAFEWTGTDRAALVVIYDAEPIKLEVLVPRLLQLGAEGAKTVALPDRAAAEVVAIPLIRRR